MTIKNQNAINAMSAGGKILSTVLKKAKKFCRAGIKTIEIDAFIENFIIESNARPSFKNFKGYPFSSCICINEELVHTLPGNRKICSGDIISLDVGVYYQGYHTDAAITFGIGKISESAKRLIHITKKSLNEGIKIISPGVKIGDVQSKIQTTIEDAGLHVIRDLSGHGIGRKLQEYPSIPNFGRPGTGFTLEEGMTFCLEPMVAIGTHKIFLSPDKWSVTTFDKSLSAHFEHTILVVKNGHKILTSID